MSSLSNSVFIEAHLAPGAALPVFPLLAPGAPIALAPLKGASYVWTFPDECTASFWCGAVRKANPAVRLWMFTCPTMCIHW
jgi:hypothetical protein